MTISIRARIMQNSDVRFKFLAKDVRSTMVRLVAPDLYELDGHRLLFGMDHYTHVFVPQNRVQKVVKDNHSYYQDSLTEAVQNRHPVHVGSYIAYQTYDRLAKHYDFDLTQTKIEDDGEGSFELFENFMNSFYQLHNGGGSEKEVLFEHMNRHDRTTALHFLPFVLKCRPTWESDIVHYKLARTEQ